MTEATAAKVFCMMTLCVEGPWGEPGELDFRTKLAKNPQTTRFFAAMHHAPPKEKRPKHRCRAVLTR
jgi:hypothetical protein